MTDAARQADGQYVVAGTFTRANGQPANMLARFDAAGTLDPVFQQNLGLATIHAFQVFILATDGAIACVVPVRAPYPSSQTIERLLPSGQPDPTFAYALPTANSTLQAIFPGPATGGYVASGIFEPDQVLARITATGAPVAGFTTLFQPFPGPADAFSGIHAASNPIRRPAAGRRHHAPKQLQQPR